MIIEPGGFDTEWHDGLHRHPQPSPYAVPDAPTTRWRAILPKSEATGGDPERAAAALIKLSHVPVRELPPRIQFGTDSWAIVKAKTEATARDVAKWSEVSHSTNKDRVDKETVI